MKVTCNHDTVIIDGDHIRFDGYTFHDELARGANGVVLKAFDINLNRPVAIKLWYSKASDTRDKLVQGRSEAIKVASIPHQNIVTIFNAGIIENCFYLVMELLPGKSLREILMDGLPSLAYRSKIWSQIVTAMRHSYRNSVYHGDLHDRNIVITDDVVKIIDFGTSYFFSNEKIKEENESLFLLKVARNIFPEIEKQLRLYNKEILKTPSFVLAYSNSWVGLISRFEILTSYFNKKLDDDNLLITSLFSISLVCAKSPYISLRFIVNELYKIGLDNINVARFLDQCYIYCYLDLNPNNESAYDYTYDDSITEKQRIERLENIRDEVKIMYSLVVDEGAIEIDNLLYS